MTSFPITHILYLAEREGRLPLSGAENHLWVLLPEQVARGHRVVLLVVLWGGGAFRVARRKLEELRAAGVDVHEFVEPELPGRVGRRIARLTSLVRLWPFLRRLRRGIVHHHLDFAHAPLVARIAGCRHTVLTIHNDYPWLAQKAGLWFRALGTVVAEFIAISERVRTYVLSVSTLPASRLTTVIYGLPAPDGEPVSRQELGLPRDVYVVGFVGRLTEQKNLDALISAVRGMPDVILAIVGGGPDAGRLAERLRTDGQHNVRLIGPLPDAARVMPAFDVLCLVSNWEGLGLVLIEAMQRGVPIIGSRRGAIPEILGEGSRGLLCEPDAASIRDAIARARREPSMMRERASRAVVEAAQLFSVERMWAETRAVYQRAMTAGERAAPGQD